MIRPLDTGYRADVDTRARSLLTAAIVVSLIGAAAHRLPIQTSWKAWMLAPLRPALIFAGSIRSALVESVSGQDNTTRSATSALLQNSLLAARADSLERELNQLRSTIALPAVMPVKGTIATVTAQFAGLGQKSLLIDKGTAVDVKVGSIVLAAIGDRAAVVGRVVEAGPTVSKVMTVLDPSCRVSASIRGSSGHVFAGAQDRALARLEFVPRDQEIATGDEVLTSEDGTIFPEGLLLGHVKYLGSGSAVFHDIFVEPAVPLEKIRYVWVTSPGRSR
ncbi:MAG: rod shape-determining protein MreC [Candidatus Hydrogenedentota bacterium]